MLPTTAVKILNRLNDAGFEAFAVGGCVRDMLRGITPDDIDITTSALPKDTIEVFSDCRVIPTGLQHGTVTVLMDGMPFEITTYRTDGNYTDSRHPDAVTFTSSLKEDLARRDFTVNAIAYHPDRGIIDPFGGRDDLKAGILRCVGEARTRFSEDALRIARLLRFMSVLDFDVEAQTAAAAHDLYERLDAVAAERKRVECMKLIMGDGFLRVSQEFADVLCSMIPALTPLRGFDQHNPHHEFDIYTHTVRAVHIAQKDPLVRLALLFHDVGKPETFFLDDHGVGHFYGHPAVSERIAKEALTTLRFDNATLHAVLPLIRYHDAQLSAERRCVRRWIARLGEDALRRLLSMKTADAVACRSNSVPPDFSAIYNTIDTVMASDSCLNLRSLAVNGHDLMAIGILEGPLIGKILQSLFEDVLADRCENEKTALLHRAKELQNHV